MRRTDTNEFGEVEYDLDYSPPTSRGDSIECEYVYYEEKPKINLKNVPEEIPQPVRTKKVVQDIYDEDNYTLARPTSDSSLHDINTPQAVDDKTSSANYSKSYDGTCSIFKKTTKIIVISIIFVLCILGGVAAIAIILGNKGENTEIKGKISIY